MSESYLQSDVLEALGYVKTDAMSNLEAKRGCVWVNRLIVATVEAVEHFEKVKDLYRDEKEIRLGDRFSDFLQKKGGNLDLWQAACGACIEEKTRPNADEAKALGFAGGALWQDLFGVFAQRGGPLYAHDCSGVEVNMREVAEKDNKENRKSLKRSIQFHTLNLAETCYRLSVLEWKLWYDHKDWSVDWGEWEVGGPFNGRGAVEALYPALKAFDEKYPNAFDDLYLALHGLNFSSDVHPRAFVSRESEKSPVWSYERVAVALLTLKTKLTFSYPADLAGAMGRQVEVFVPSPFLTKARGLFLHKLYENFSANAQKALSDVSRRMWFEAAAELLQNNTRTQPVYSQEAAERIVSLANRAQRESWIERMMVLAKKKKEMEPAEFPSPPPPPSAKVEPAVSEQAILEKAKAYVEGRLAGIGGISGGETKKDVKKGGKKGDKGTSETRGRQTEAMISQFARFQVYMRKHHVPLHCSLETLKKRVHGFWLENKTEFDLAAKVKGAEKGYGSEAMLLRAARNKGYGPKPKQ